VRLAGVLQVPSSTAAQLRGSPKQGQMCHGGQVGPESTGPALPATTSPCRPDAGLPAVHAVAFGVELPAAAIGADGREAGPALVAGRGGRISRPAWRPGRLQPRQQHLPRRWSLRPGLPQPRRSIGRHRRPPAVLPTSFHRVGSVLHAFSSARHAWAGERRLSFASPEVSILTEGQYSGGSPKGNQSPTEPPCPVES